jgi:hypothetical protein
VPTKSSGAKVFGIVDIVIYLLFTFRTVLNVNEHGGKAGWEEAAMNITQRDRDLGTAYAMRPSGSRTELTEVGRGTPMGELLRRYWHPIGLVADATDIPRKVRVLAEDLIATGMAVSACCTPAAAIAAPRSIMARSRRTASAAAITAGSSIPKAAALNSPANPMAASSGTRCASPGTRLPNAMG